MEWKPGIIYLQHTDKNGKSYIDWHPCWDIERFEASQYKAAVETSGSVSRVTEQEYRAFKWPKHSQAGG